MEIIGRVVRLESYQPTRALPRYLEDPPGTERREPAGPPVLTITMVVEGDGAVAFAFPELTSVGALRFRLVHVVD